MARALRLKVVAAADKAGTARDAGFTGTDAATFRASDGDLAATALGDERRPSPLQAFPVRVAGLEVTRRDAAKQGQKAPPIEALQHRYFQCTAGR